MNSKMKTMVFVFCIFLAFLLGYWLRTPVVPADESSASQAMGLTCSMHPQIRQSKMGKCPLCGMDLIPVTNDLGSECGPKELKLSEAAEKLAAIETAPVERKFVLAEIRMFGKIAYNSDTLCYVNSRFAGRIDKLFVKSSGMAVKKGARLAEVYSQELLVLLQELVQALNVKETRPNDPATLAFFNSIKEKYRLSGFSEDQVEEIISKVKATDRLTVNSQVSGILLSITSPISGVLVEKTPVVGKFFDKGEILFTVADLSRVWINVEAYETDLPWLKYGQDVEFTTEACPGIKFNGRIALIQPILDEATRTVKIRIVADNKEGGLKPGMFVNAIVCAKIADGGKVVDSSLAGKWISPMHPEIIKDAPGICDLCETPLVSAESMGLVDENDKNLQPPLVIPSTAPLITGKRAVVYVAVPGKNGVYEGREVSLGVRSGNYFIVESGLQEGENVVTNGNFKIDSSFQILAKSSMMTPPRADTPAPAPLVEEEIKIKNAPPPPDEILLAYFALQRALFADNLIDALKDAGKLDERYESSIASSNDLNAVRKNFEGISKRFYREIAVSAENLKSPVYKFFCPMAFNNRGAFWLQDNDKIQNPYFGPAMPTCGELKETIPAGK